MIVAAIVVVVLLSGGDADGGALKAGSAVQVTTAAGTVRIDADDSVLQPGGAQEKFKTAFQKGLASGLGISPGAISNIKIVKNRRRNLRATTSIRVSYTVTVSSSTTNANDLVAKAQTATADKSSPLYKAVAMQLQAVDLLPAMINCIGNYAKWSACDKKCGGGKMSAKYTITTRAKYGGDQCVNADGATVLADCNEQACAPPGPPCKNWALKKPTKQSSEGWGGASARAVDGNSNPQYGGGSCTHTNGKPAWWQVDLGQSVNVKTVVVVHRGDCAATASTQLRSTSATRTAAP